MRITRSDQLAIRTVIEQQLQAFQANDGERAFSCASPAIQQQFQSADSFLWMVKRSYHPVYRPRAVVFEDLTQVHAQPTQQVMVMSANGHLFRAYYLMECQPDRTWRIAGCHLMVMEDA